MGLSRESWVDFADVEQKVNMNSAEVASLCSLYPSPRSFLLPKVEGSQLEEYKSNHPYLKLLMYICLMGSI